LSFSSCRATGGSAHAAIPLRWGTYAVFLELADEHIGEELARLVGVADILERLGCVLA